MICIYVERRRPNCEGIRKIRIDLQFGERVLLFSFISSNISWFIYLILILVFLKLYFITCMIDIKNSSFVY